MYNIVYILEYSLYNIILTYLLEVWNSLTRVHTVYTIQLRAQNLRQGIVLKTSFETRVSRMGLGSFVDINIFVMKYHLKFLHILLYFESLKLKST